MANLQPQDKPFHLTRPSNMTHQADIVDSESEEGDFLSSQVKNDFAKSTHKVNEHQMDPPGLLFINETGPAGPTSQERQRIRAHVMLRHLYRRKWKSVQEHRSRGRGGMPVAPTVDQVLGAGGVDPFHTLPVSMSSSNSRLLYHFAQHIAPLHYPRGRGMTECNPMTTTWVKAALMDPALFHSTLGSSSGLMLHNDNLPTMPPVLLSVYLSHKAKTIRILNERMTNSSQALSDETLGAIALLVTGQTRQGDYKEMNIHMRGLKQLVDMRGGLETLGMSGLLAGEVIWCDNVTAFLSSSNPLLEILDIGNSLFEVFEDTELNIVLADCQTRHDDNSCLRSPTLNQILSGDIIAALRSLDAMTAFLDTFPTLSEHDMLVYDRKRASIQHQLANIAISPTVTDPNGITESCRIAAILYSIFVLWGFRPPMKLYGDLSKMLQQNLLLTNDVCNWGTLSDMLLWTMFIGGYGAFGSQERRWFLARIKDALRSRNIDTWHSVKEVLQFMPVCHTLWDPFEALWREAAAALHEGAGAEGFRRL